MLYILSYKNLLANFHAMCMLAIFKNNSLENCYCYDAYYCRVVDFNILSPAQYFIRNQFDISETSEMIFVGLNVYLMTIFFSFVSCFPQFLHFPMNKTFFQIVYFLAELFFDAVQSWFLTLATQPFHLETFCYLFI